MTPAEYEFSNSQNELIGDLAKKMNFVATLLIALGVLALIAGILSLISVFTEPGPEAISAAINGLIQGIFSLLIGTWTKNAASAFKQIVSTAGTDIENLMIALGELRKLYTLQYWLSLIALIFVAIAFVFVIIAFVATVLGAGG